MRDRRPCWNPKRRLAYRATGVGLEELCPRCGWRIVAHRLPAVLRLAYALRIGRGYTR